MPSTKTTFAAAGEQRDPVAAYKAALRHTRRVRFLRRALPAAILLCVSIIVIGSWLDPLRLLGELPIEFARLAISGSKLKIEAPKLSGYTIDGRAYSVTAEIGRAGSRAARDNRDDRDRGALRACRRRNGQAQS